MSDQFSAIGVAIAALGAKTDAHGAKLDDILAAFANFAAGQARIMELLEMVNRQLATLNQAVAQEPESESLALLLRALLVQLDAAIRSLAGMPHAVAAKVVLETDGLVLPPEC